MKPGTQKLKLLSRTLIMITTIAISFPIASCSQSNKEIAIDGKTFTVLTMEKGKPETSSLETITFAAGMFDNLGCHIWGFGNGKYVATRDGENINFEATTSSPKEGEMIWKGMIMGDVLHGEMIWRKAGQADLQYTFDSRNIEMVSLDGQSFTLQMMENDSVITEVVTFNSGKFESPSCYEWGFTASPYSAWKSNGNIQWQSLYESQNEGKMLFTGTITGNAISGTQLWSKAGQDDIYYSMTGTANQ